jgi:hypothetical protein
MASAKSFLLKKKYFLCRVLPRMALVKEFFKKNIFFLPSASMQGTRQRVFFLIKYFLCRMPPERALGKELFLKKIWHSTKNLFLKKFNFFVEGFRVWHLAKKIEKKYLIICRVSSLETLGKATVT